MNYSTFSKSVFRSKVMWVVVACLFGYAVFVSSMGGEKEDPALREARLLLETMEAEASYTSTWNEFTDKLDLDENAIGYKGKDLESLRGLVHERMIEIYAEVYTVKELRGIRSFYESEAGKAYLQNESALKEKYFDLYWELLDTLLLKATLDSD